MKIILASSSPRRREILKSINTNFESYSPDINEAIVPGENPIKYSERISEEKANSIVPLLNRKDPWFIIGCDTIVTLDDKILGKPLNFSDAIEGLKFLSGRTHSVISSVTVLYNKETIIKNTESEISHVSFKQLDDKKIKKYLNSIDYSDKAGGYAIQENGDLIIDNIDGSLSNIIGFPLRLFLKMISQMNIANAFF